MFGSVRWILTVAACVLVGIACSNAPNAVTAPESTSEPVSNGGEAGIVYVDLDGVALTMDVHVPEQPVGSERARPVVVLFHGLSAATNDAADVALVAEAATAAGMVVFAPEWIDDDPFPVFLDDIEMLRRAGECAVAFAQAEAPRFGGDPARTVTSGFSAGTSPALAAAVTPVDGTSIPGCATPAVTEPVVGTVLGDGEYFWQSEPFDGAFAADPAGMRAEAALLIDASKWTRDPALRIRLWVAAERTAPRALAPGVDDVDWLAARDGDGSIRSELEAAGALDDGSIDYVDAALLLEARAESAGFDVDLVVYPGGHTTDDKVPAIIEHLSAAAAES